MAVGLVVSTAFASLTPKPTPFSLICHQNHPSAEKRPWRKKQGGNIEPRGNYADCASLIQVLSRKKMPVVAERLFLDMKSEGFVPDNSTLSALMLCYANNGLFSKALVAWDEIINSSYLPDVHVIAELIDIYGCKGYLDVAVRILHQIKLKDSNLLRDVYVRVISRFGKKGQLELMEIMLKEMVSMGFPVDSATGNAYVIYYSNFGTLSEMEVAYGRLKMSRILIEEEAIRSISLAYLKEEKLYSLGQFVRDVGLSRRNVGNLLWNLLLLSYAVNFKMKSLQREFVRMVESGFLPDLNTFNIRALAFSKMSLFWDLHVTLEHMKHEKVVPDLVTYGSVVDAYLDRNLGRNLDFALQKFNKNDCVTIATDPLVFEAMGKGDFHLSSEARLEFSKKKNWTYEELISTYLKKYFRRNQIFWNY
ncbi:pentatricopeptide repeat-containing protein At3g42630 isoform X1 [Lycium ferocissimum]|uniref:pentatricopeptide repeat-containing protein At3g42630 isoform X1 n=2 Tax=Lycium ferocissimum TaxID=112874 RepID=UPI0028155CAB|nr:pentatricopeptide repeat-containing protein At3g42630 isoform X1 [Lycium ferocissimum]XP_059318489.1 pentatricopeptide repeat-containing protein At3g42630 isoform X1 [Lycium ferocissimum]XP_059318490.1 pentatricopeptide repeat-containing protein At3g42630 isoform X1 [Lycium ferocissimum]XP_059318492.1 pentatricopeptide repeat-containing protein At3g42630 isoform X1 [Lycium ferocissimum]XP_059318493.1 pentatricopeptide repeat-containing protein At3g42630 isoform X1 [Lycium ferocissimum]XP_05